MPAFQKVLTSLSYLGSILPSPFSTADTRYPLLGSSSSAISDVVAMETLPLFGRSLAWNRTGSDGVTWVSVDDRVRGGSSVSHFDLVKPSGDSSAANDALVDGVNIVQDARFWGTLDTETLGGAGFSSVTTDYTDEKTSLDLSSYDGIVLEIVRADAKKYTFNLKDEVPGRRDDGRRKSAISFEYSFSIAPNALNRDVSHSIYIPWDSLTPTYRGRKIDHPGIRRDEVRKFSIMMRSFFDQQAGDFELVLRSISAYKKATSESVHGKI